MILLTPAKLYRISGGQRVVAEHKLRGGRVQTIVTNPINDENWLIEPDYLHGGAPRGTIFDIDSNGLILSVSILRGWLRQTGLRSPVRISHAPILRPFPIHFQLEMAFLNISH